MAMNIFPPKNIAFGGALKYKGTIIGYELRGSILNIVIPYNKLP